MLEVLAQAQSSGQKAQEDARRGQGSIFDLGGDGQRRSPPTARRPSARPVPARSSTSASCCGWRRRRSARSSRPIRSARCATRCARGSTARSPTWPSKRRRRLGDGRRDRQRGEEGPHAQRRLRDVRDPRRPRGAGRAVRSRRRGRGGRGRSRSTAWSSSAAGSTTRGAARSSLVVARGRARSSPARTSWRRRGRRPAARDPEPIVLRVDAAEFGPQLIEELKASSTTSRASARSCSRCGPARERAACGSAATTG